MKPTDIHTIIFKFRNLSENSKTIAKNTTFAALFKGLGLFVSFLSTPVFIHYFKNDVVLGLWFTMLSILSWFLTFDLGIGNGIRNHLVKALTSGNRIEVKKIISSGILSSAIITSFLFILGVFLIFFIDLNKLFNISSHIISTHTLIKCTLLVFGAIMIRFFLNCISSILYAIQKAAINNLLALVIGILQLIYILIFRFDNIEKALLYISIAYLIISNAPVIIAGIYIFTKSLKDCRPNFKFFTVMDSKKLMNTGVIFFLCQISFMIISNTNKFFISHFWGTIYTTAYSFYYRIVMLLSIVFSLALTPTWSMVTKAYEEKNYMWIKKTFKSLNYIALFFIFLEFASIPFLQNIMDFWLGKGQIKVSYFAASAFSMFGATYIYSSLLSTIVCGLSKMKMQLYCFVTGAILKIFLILIIAVYSSLWEWVIWINSSILFIYCILEILHISNIFSKLNLAK